MKLYSCFLGKFSTAENCAWESKIPTSVMHESELVPVCVTPAEGRWAALRACSEQGSSSWTLRVCQAVQNGGTGPSTTTEDFVVAPGQSKRANGCQQRQLRYAALLGDGSSEEEGLGKSLIRVQTWQTGKMEWESMRWSCCEWFLTNCCCC